MPAYTEGNLSQNFMQELLGYPSKLAHIPGGQISFREAGQDRKDAIPLVLLHGIGSGAASWSKQLDSVGQARRVVAWDAPGYGESTPVKPCVPVAADYAEVLFAWLETIEIDRCVMVGHSLGAIIAGGFALAHGSKLAGLLLLSPARGYGNASAEVRDGKRNGRLEMLRTLGPEGLARERSSNMLSSAASDEARLFVHWNMSKVVPEGYEQATHLLANADLAADISRFRGRIAVAVGAEDTITPASACEPVARAAGVALQIVPQAGHAGYIELPGVYSNLIETFCRTCESW
ncbi:alpha/beta hydrolase (plasmid) [Caballeronia sp. NK8]|nr:alpha/beta hydrolase [Caballeronia sp. NK8]